MRLSLISCLARAGFMRLLRARRALIRLAARLGVMWCGVLAGRPFDWMMGGAMDKDEMVKVQLLAPKREIDELCANTLTDVRTQAVMIAVRTYNKQAAAKEVA